MAVLVQRRASLLSVLGEFSDREREREREKTLSQHDEGTGVRFNGVVPGYVDNGDAPQSFHRVDAKRGGSMD